MAQITLFIVCFIPALLVTALAEEIKRRRRA